MKPIGRKLVFNFGDTTIAIEMYPKGKGSKRYEVPHEKTALLFNIIDFDGEFIEQGIGESAHYCYGADFNGHHPKFATMAWITLDEAKAGVLGIDSSYWEDKV